MATPMIEEAKKKWPNSTIVAWCKPSYGPLLAHHPLVSEIVTDSAHLPKDLDVGILLPQSFSSAWELFRARIPTRIGFATDGRSLLLTERIPLPKEKGSEHLVDTYKRLLGVPFSSSRPALYVTSEEQEEAGRWLSKQMPGSKRPWIAVHAAAAFGPAKCWPAASFRQLVQRFTHVDFLFFGDHAARTVIEPICTGLSHTHNLAGETPLRLMIAALTLCDAMISNDSGPMHVAAALRVPLLALFGSTNPIATGPYQHGEVLQHPVPCSPCYRKVCPIDFPCMRGLSVDRVAHQLQAMLQSSKQS